MALSNNTQMTIVYSKLKSVRFVCLSAPSHRATHYHYFYSKLNFYSSYFISYFSSVKTNFFFLLQWLWFSSSFSLFAHEIIIFSSLFYCINSISFCIEIKIFCYFLISPIEFILTAFYQLEFLPSFSTIHKKIYYLYIS